MSPMAIPAAMPGLIGGCGAGIAASMEGMGDGLGVDVLDSGLDVWLLVNDTDGVWLLDGGGNGSGFRSSVDTQPDP